MNKEEYKVFTEASIEDSYIYKTFNQSNGLVENIIKYIKNSVALDKTYFEEQYMQLKKLPVSPLVQKVMASYDNGEIELRYTTVTKVSKTIPFIIRRTADGQMLATIFISSFATMDTNDNLVIQVKQLYALMESAYIALQIQKNPVTIQRNATLMRITEACYTQMMIRILNKEYSLSLDKQLYDKVTYAINRFFITNIWGLQNQSIIHQYAKMELKNLPDMDLELLNQAYESSDIKSINDLVIFLAGMSPRMTGLNVRYYIEKYINLYHGSTILSIDYLPYVLFVITNVILSSFLVNQKGLNDIIKNIKGIERFYPELSRSI